MAPAGDCSGLTWVLCSYFNIRKMKKWILLVLISAVSVGVAADSAHAIFGGMAWRVNARRNGAGFFSGRRGRIIKAARARKQSESNSAEL